MIKDTVKENRQSEEQHIRLYLAEGKTEEMVAMLSYLCFEMDETALGKTVALYLNKNYPEAVMQCRQGLYHRIQYNTRTGLSGINKEGHIIRRGSVDALQSYFWAMGHSFPDFALKAEHNAKKQGMELFAIACDGELMGLIAVKSFCTYTLQQTMPQWMAVTA